MENNFEREPIFKIENPQEGDEVALAPMHIQAWKEAYIVPESGLTEESIDVMLSHLKGEIGTGTIKIKNMWYSFP